MKSDTLKIYSDTIKVNNNMINLLLLKLTETNENDPRRINHGFKVYCIAKLIAYMEDLDAKTSAIIEAAAVLHDIGIRFAEENYSSSSGKLQEKHGQIIARPMLEAVSNDKEFIDRVIYLIANHHTYEGVEGIDYQVIIEADFIVNVQEGNITLKAFNEAKKRYFKTSSGIILARKYLTK